MNSVTRYTQRGFVAVKNLHALAMVAVLSLLASPAFATGGTDYSALSDAVSGEWTAGKPTLMAIFAVILAIAAVFVLFRRSKSAAK